MNIGRAYISERTSAALAVHPFAWTRAARPRSFDSCGCHFTYSQWYWYIDCLFLIVDCDTLYVFTQYLYVSHNKFIFAPLLTSTCILQAVVRAQLSWLEAVRCVVHAVHESIDAVRHGLRTIQVTREETVYDAVMDIYQWENVVNLAEDLWHQPYRSRTRHT